MLLNGQKAGVEFESERGMKGWVWWLDGVDVSVMVWCQTLCHCKCHPHKTHPSMVSHSPVCLKAIVLFPLQSVCW